MPSLPRWLTPGSLCRITILVLLSFHLAGHVYSRSFPKSSRTTTSVNAVVHGYDQSFLATNNGVLVLNHRTGEQSVLLAGSETVALELSPAGMSHLFVCYKSQSVVLCQLRNALPPYRNVTAACTLPLWTGSAFHDQHSNFVISSSVSGTDPRHPVYSVYVTITRQDGASILLQIDFQFVREVLKTTTSSIILGNFSSPYTSARRLQMTGMSNQRSGIFSAAYVLGREPTKPTVLSLHLSASHQRCIPETSSIKNATKSEYAPQEPAVNILVPTFQHPEHNNQGKNFSLI